MSLRRLAYTSTHDRRGNRQWTGRRLWVDLLITAALVALALLAVFVITSLVVAL